MIPRLSLHKKINGWIMDSALNDFAEKILPNFELVITSGYRTPEYNATLPGAAKDSAHIYNLARDFNLKNISTGRILTDTELKKVFNRFVKPNWNGYTYYSSKKPNTSTGWIHVNLDRGISKKTFYLALAGMGTTGFIAFKKFVLPYIIKPTKKKA